MECRLKRYMTVDELQSREPPASIGAHTVTHPALSLLDQQMHCEMVDNRTYLQECSGVEVTDLAYPFGNPFACGLREAGLAAQAGFRTAATTSKSAVACPGYARLLYATSGQYPSTLDPGAC
jgi:peptidoglycan/xylan/chitin deacetylase (PgdA/CDA1 family)